MGKVEKKKRIFLEERGFAPLFLLPPSLIKGRGVRGIGC